MNSIFHRTSVRKYTNQPVEQEKIEKILRAGMAAPSAMNQQPWEFYVVEYKEVLEKLSTCSQFAVSVEKSAVTFVVCYRKAPSAMNQQPWEFYVVEYKEVLEKLSTCSQFAVSVEKSAVTFVVCYRNDSLRADYREIDCSACTENMLLEIDHLGLGAVWIGIAPIKERMDDVAKVLDMPENLSAFALIACGYPESIKEQQKRLSSR